MTVGIWANTHKVGPTGSCRGHTQPAEGGKWEIDCPECEEAVRKQPGMWGDRLALVPLTPEEVREEEAIQRDVALANAATGRAIRDEQTARVRAQRSQRRPNVR